MSRDKNFYSERSLHIHVLRHDQLAKSVFWTSPGSEVS